MNRAGIVRRLAPLLLLTACYSWQAQPGPVPQAVVAATSGASGDLRVHLKNGARITLFDARVFGDSVAGMSAKEPGVLDVLFCGLVCRATQTHAVRRTVALADVQSFDAYERNVGEFVLRAVLLIGLTALVLALIFADSSG